MPDDRDDLAERAQRGDLDAATLALAEQAIRSDPSDARARVIAARCFEAAGELDDAAAQLDEVLAMDPSRADRQAACRAQAR
jgi:Tfp pilus assembly protein PilF